MKVGQKVLREKFNKEFKKSEKISSRLWGPYTVLWEIAKTVFETELDENPAKTLHSPRNHLLGKFLKDATLPSLIEAYNGPQESQIDHRKVNRKVTETAVNDYIQYVPRAWLAIYFFFLRFACMFTALLSNRRTWKSPHVSLFSCILSVFCLAWTITVILRMLLPHCLFLILIVQKWPRINFSFWKNLET